MQFPVIEKTETKNGSISFVRIRSIFTASKSVVPAPEAFSDKFFRKMQYAAVHKTYNASDRLADTMDPLQ